MGYALTLPVGVKGSFAMDDVELYGKADQSLRASVTADSAVHPVKEGATATVKLSVATTGAAPIDEPVTVAYESAGAPPSPARTTHRSRARSPSRRAPPPAPPAPSRSRRCATSPPNPPRRSPEAHGHRREGPAETPQIVIDAHGLPYLDPKLPVKKRVADLVSRMSLEEKAGQMTQAERGALTAQGDIATYDLGSLLSGGGSTPTPNTPRPGRR